MAKKSKRSPRGDKYATKAADAQASRKQLNKRWEDSQQELNKQRRGSAKIHEVLNDPSNDDSAVQLLQEIFGAQD